MDTPSTIRGARDRLLLGAFMMMAIGRSVFAEPESLRRTPTRPAAVWPSSLLEVIVAFDKAIDPATANAFVGKNIRYFEPGEMTGDRTGSARPSGSLRIVGARLTDGGRTVALATDPHPRLARYVVPGADGVVNSNGNGASLPGWSYNLSGVEAAWSPEGGPDAQPSWTGWWPALDLEATRKLTRGSKRHDDGLALLARSGRLTLATMIRLPVGAITVRIESSQPIEEALLGETQADLTGPVRPPHHHHAVMKVQSQGEPLFLSMTCRTGANGGPFALTAVYRTGEEAIDHEMTPAGTILPWAPAAAAAATAPLIVPDLAGGDPVRGKVLFNGERARCSQCHTFRGNGGQVGPDLTGIGAKSRAEIYRSIAAPSDSIAPEFTTYTVATKNGQVLVGIVRVDGPDAIRVTDTNAHAALVARREIDQLRPSANSIMPVGLTGALGDAAVRDLIAFLTDRPLRPH